MDTYEKKYKNALTIAQSRFKIEKDESVLTCLGMMFPELRESEDERIRKAIFKALSKKDARDVLLAEGVQVSEALSYLEKQKEQKPAEKQDYSGLNDLERAIHRGFLVAGVENVSVTIIKQTAQDCLAHMHAEWSEEDEKMMEKIDCYLSSAIGVSEEERQNIEKWLKSLRPQPKQEWTEEDKENIESIKIILRKALSKGINCEAEILDLTDWLQSLCPSWEPTEELLDALDVALGNLIDKINSL